MRIIVSILLCFSLASLNAQPSKQNLNGPIKTLVQAGIHLRWRTFVNKFDRQGRIIEEQFFSPLNNKLTLDTTKCVFYYGRSWSFDENGRVTSETTFNKNKVLSKTTKKY